MGIMMGCSDMNIVDGPAIGGELYIGLSYTGQKVELHVMNERKGINY